MTLIVPHIHRITFLLILLVFPLHGWAASFDSNAREGVIHYNQEEYERAATKFQQSQQKQSDNRDVAYNLANSLYRLGRYKEAVDAYKKTLDEETRPTLRQKSYYNMGNAYYRMGYMEESIDAYKKALELDSGDIESKFNLEWVRKQREKAQQAGRVGPRDENILQQQTTHEGANNPPDPQEGPEKPSDTKPSSQNNQKPEESSPQDNQPKPSKKSAAVHPDSSNDAQISKEEQTVQDALQEMTRMTPEEAERWLGSLSEDLKKFARRQMQGKMKDMFADHDKDW